MQTKPCRVCGERKPLTDFHRKRENRDGHDNRCKKCISIIRKASNQVKKCSICFELKPLAEFYRNKRAADGHDYRCKLCDDIRKGRHTRTNGSGYMRLVAQAERNPCHSCSKCDDNPECRERVHAGLWVRCERPDVADMVRYERMIA